MIDEGRKTTKRDNSKNIRFSELWMHRLVCRTKFNIILPDKPCRKVELAESRFMNGGLIKSILVAIFGSMRNFCHIGSWYWKNDIPRTSRTIAKVTNNLKGRANTINMK